MNNLQKLIESQKVNIFQHGIYMGNRESNDDERIDKEIKDWHTASLKSILEELYKEIQEQNAIEIENRDGTKTELIKKDSTLSTLKQAIDLLDNK